MISTWYEAYGVKGTGIIIGAPVVFPFPFGMKMFQQNEVSRGLGTGIHGLCHGSRSQIRDTFWQDVDRKFRKTRIVS
jgi:hypothetical protein